MSHVPFPLPSTTIPDTLKTHDNASPFWGSWPARPAIPDTDERLTALERKIDRLLEHHERAEMWADYDRLTREADRVARR